MSSRSGRCLGASRVMLLPPAAFAVHQLRYELTYGSRAGVVLQETGHSYLHSAVPWMVALIATALGGFLYRAGRTFVDRRAPAEFAVSFLKLWLLCAVALVAIFACQETLEGIFLAGHPPGWSAVFGDGGWWAIPVAICVGLVLAAVFHGARWAVGRLARCRSAPMRPRATRPVLARLTDVIVAPPAPLLAGWSSRGPPS